MLHKFLSIKFILIIVFCLIILFPLIYPFLLSGTIDTFDGNLHEFRIAAFHASILEGSIPPRWSSTLAYGWGSPVLSFNWSLPYWLAEPILFLHWSITDAYKMVIILSIVLFFSTTFALYWYWLSIWSALAAATLSVWSLFYLYTLFVTGAIGMLVALIFWPLLILSIVFAQKKYYKRAYLLGSFAIAGTMISHQVMFLLFMPFLFYFVFIAHLHQPKSHMLHTFFLILFTGLGLTAFFWLPAIVEKQFINISTTEVHYLGNFIPFAQLFTQPNFYTINGDYWWKKVYGNQFFGIGWPIVIVVILAVAQGIKKKKLEITFFFLSLFFMLPASVLFWTYIPLLSSFIYPVRFLWLAVFCAGGIAALYISQVKQKAITSICLVCITIAFNYSGIPNVLHRINYDDSFYHSGNSTSDMGGEFLSKWTAVKMEQAEIITATADIKIENIVKKQTQISFDIVARTETDIQINQIYFPGWKIFVDNKNTQYTVLPSGAMQIHIQQGSHRIIAIFTDTPIRSLGNSISILSVVALILINYFVMKH